MTTNVRKEAERKEIHHHRIWGAGDCPGRQDPGECGCPGDHKESTLVQSYGPEARGGACSAQVIISDRPIHYPHVRHSDILVCMSQAGFDKFIGQLKDDGILLIDQDLVHPQGLERDYFAIPSTRMAEELGRKMMANIIMLGFFAAVTGAVSVEAARTRWPDRSRKGLKNRTSRPLPKAVTTVWPS